MHAKYFGSSDQGNDKITLLYTCTRLVRLQGRGERKKGHPYVRILPGCQRAGSSIPPDTCRNDVRSRSACRCNVRRRVPEPDPNATRTHHRTPNHPDHSRTLKHTPVTSSCYVRSVSQQRSYLHTKKRSQFLSVALLPKADKVEVGKNSYL